MKSNSTEIRYRRNFRKSAPYSQEYLSFERKYKHALLEIRVWSTCLPKKCVNDTGISSESTGFFLADDSISYVRIMLIHRTICESIFDLRCRRISVAHFFMRRTLDTTLDYLGATYAGKILLNLLYCKMSIIILKSSNLNWN